MTVLALLAAALAANPHLPGCAGDRLVIAPFEPLMLTAAAARETELQVREALERIEGLCVEPRAETVKTLLGSPTQALPLCADPACHTAQAAQLGGRWLLTGTVLGVGGRRSVSLNLAASVGGPSRRATVVLQGPFALTSEFERLFRPEANPSPRRRSVRWPGLAAGGAGLAGVAAGLVLGALSRQTANGISQGRTGCPGGGADYAECFDQRLRQGREQALAANLLLGSGVLVGTGGAAMLVFDFP